MRVTVSAETEVVPAFSSSHSFSFSLSHSLFVSHSVAPFLSAASYLGNKTKNATNGEAAQNKSKNETTTNNNRSKATRQSRETAKQAKENLLSEMQNKLNLRLFALTNVFAGVQLLIAKFI